MRPSPSARRTEQFLHFDTPAGYDDPVGMLLGCHRRIEKKLSTLKSLAAHLSAKGMDAESSAAAQAVLRYFNTPAMHHHDDEERDLLPLLASRLSTSAEREELAALEAQIRREHEDIDRIWARLRKPLESIADGLSRALPDSDVQALATLYREHIALEERVLVPMIAKHLTEADVLALGRAMAARRGAPF